MTYQIKEVLLADGDSPFGEWSKAPGLARMMDAMAADRAFNRVICR